MRSEIELILLGSVAKRSEEEDERFTELLKNKQDWAWITGQLIRHRLNGNFYSGMSASQRNYIVNKVRQAFDLMSCCYEAANKENLIFFQTLNEKCNKAGIVTAGLKGVVFNTYMYPLGARRSNDMDILVAEEDLKVFDSVMRELGFIQSLDGGRTEASRREKMIQIMNYHDLVPYFKRIELPYLDCLKVDVNFQFDTKENLVTRAILDEGTQVYEGNGYRIQGLKLPNHFSHLCVHFYREASNSLWTSKVRDVDLYKLVDIENTFRGFSDDEKLAWIENVKKYKLEKQCYFTIYYLNQFYPCSIYEKLMGLIKPEDTSFVNKIVMVGDKRVEERRMSFYDQTFDMNYGMDFAERDFTKVF